MSLFYLGLTDNIRGPLYPDLVQKFELSHMVGSLFFAVASLAGLLGSAVITAGLKRSGYKLCFQISLALMVTSQFFYALSPDFKFFLFSSFVLGFSIGTLGVIQNVLVLVASPLPRLSRLMSGLHTNYAGASLLSPLLVALGVMLGQGFRFSFWVTGALGIILLASSFAIPEFLEADHTVVSEGPSAKTFSRPSLFLASSLALYVLAEILASTRLAHFCRSRWQCSLSESSGWVALFFGGLFLGRLLLTFFQAPGRLRSQLTLAFCGAALSSLLGVLISPWFFFFVGVLMAPCYPLTMSLLKEEFSEHLESVAAICVFASHLAVITMHLGVGVISDQLGIESAMILIPCACFVSLGCLFLSKPRGNRTHA